MDRQNLSAICRQVYRQFPEVSGCEPRVQDRPNQNTLLIFQGKGSTPDGRTIPRTVRVTVDAAGKIAKISTSR